MFIVILVLLSFGCRFEKVRMLEHKAPLTMLPSHAEPPLKSDRVAYNGHRQDWLQGSIHFVLRLLTSREEKKRHTASLAQRFDVPDFSQHRSKRPLQSK